MTNVRKINLPAVTRIGTAGNENYFEIVWADLPDSVLGPILEGGAKVVMTNAYNSGGKDVPVADRVSNRARRYAAWKRGEYAMTATGPRESVNGEMREAYIAKQVALGKTVKQAEEAIRATVTAAFGKDDKATFPRFLDAVATIKAKQGGEYDAIRAELEDAAMARVEELRKERAESTAELDLDLSDLF